MSITVLVLIVAGTSIVAALTLSGCGTGLFPPGDRTTNAAIPEANEDAFVTTDGPAIARVRIITLDGVFVLFDAAIPKNDLADRKPAYVAWWNDFAAQKRFVFDRLIESQADVGHALLNLERDLDIDLDSLIDDNPALNQAIVEAAAESVDAIDWQPATYGTAMQVMGFPAPQPTGDPDMDRLLFANGGVDEFYGNLCRPASRTTTELLPSPGPLPGPYMPITLAIRLSGCGYGEPAVDESRAVAENDTSQGPTDAAATNVVLFEHCFFPYKFCLSRSPTTTCDGPCCDDPCCDDDYCGSPPDGGCGDNPCCGLDVDPCCHVDCDDGNHCTADSCQDGVCGHVPVDCNDFDSCTRDSCNPASGCVNEPVPAPEDKCACWDFEFDDVIDAAVASSFQSGTYSNPGQAGTLIDQSMTLADSFNAEVQAGKAAIELCVQNCELPDLSCYEQCSEDLLNEILDSAGALAGLTGQLAGVQYSVIPHSAYPVSGDVRFGVVGLPEGVASVPLSIDAETVSWLSTKSFGNELWSSFSPITATVGATSINVTLNGNYGVLRLGATWDECTRTKSIDFTIEGYTEEFVFGVHLQQYRTNEGRIQSDRGKMDATRARWQQGIDALGLIPEVGSILAAAASGELGLWATAATQALDREDAANCQQLHADYQSAEALPEEFPKGGEEDQNPTQEANQICGLP